MRGYRRVRLAALSFAGLLLGASLPVWALHWPWHRPHRVAPAPAPVMAVAVSVPGAATGTRGSALPQAWDGNALLLDLTGQSGRGSAVLQPYAGIGWPVRMEFRVRPGSVARLEVQGTQRVVFFVPAQGGTQLLRLDPGVYGPHTARVTLRWSGAGDSAP